jgi:putative PIN family toxin of toxin-antitoxin system
VHKIVIDTNVFISAILSKSYPSKIINELILDRKVIGFTSPEILNEFRTVLAYPKFKRYSQFQSEGEELYLGFQALTTIVSPQISLKILSDPSDDKFLELSYFVNADFIITGNTKHFPFAKFQNTEIITPANYWKEYWS